MGISRCYQNPVPSHFSLPFFSLSPLLSFFLFLFLFCTLGHFYTEYPPKRLCNISCMYLSPRGEIVSNPQAGKEAACMHQAVTSTLGQCRGTRHFYHFLYARRTYTMVCLAVNISSTIEAQIQPPKNPSWLMDRMQGKRSMGTAAQSIPILLTHGLTVNGFYSLCSYGPFVCVS